MVVIKCSILNLDVKNENPSKRWLCQVSVTLEKHPGNVDVQKLRAIFLIKADFNDIHKKSSILD